jgi:hypothetical protein
MKKFTSLFSLAMILALTALMPIKAQSAIGVQGERFTKIFYFYGASGKGSASGLDAGNAKAIADTDIMSISAGTVIEDVYVVIDTAVSGTTVMTIGDDDDADGFVPNGALTLGTPGIYANGPKDKAKYALTTNYLAESVNPSGSTGDYYVVPKSKYYSAAGKEVKLDITTTNTGGAFRVIVQGFRLR